jgi:predicted dehydrogenase/threonine dehydrogenase-like Zn-dependent dehydrogenase
MLQIIQYQKTGRLSVEELPSPLLQDGGVLVRNIASLVSVGTERSSVETAQASMLGKARSRPDLVKQVMENAKREGVKATIRKVQNRLDNYKELGYSSAGVVVESSVDAFKSGDRVACAGLAHHAEIVFIPRHLAARIPDGVSFVEAAFTTVGAIALQGVRQANVRLGENVAVIGLGLIGLLTVQLLKANGCRVIGLDISESNFGIARELGCDVCTPSTRASVRTVESFTGGLGTDAVLLTASTSSSEPMELALQFARKRSSVVIVGAVGLNIPRSPFYEKELDVRISCSYGPGRYDTQYETRGIDYPVGYVRWTENRNMQAVLDLISQKRLNVERLVSHRFQITDALKAYDIVTGKEKAKSIGIIIGYGTGAGAEAPGRVVLRDQKIVSAGKLAIGFIGAGNFAQSYLLPTLQKEGATLRGVVTSRPVNAKAVAKKFGFEYCATSPEEILGDAAITTVFIATRHDSHARLAMEALKSGKHVFVEKPLAINAGELRELGAVYERTGDKHLMLMTGFNRRFSHPFKSIHGFFTGTREPFVITYRVHGGPIPESHWLQDDIQGGRIVGEVCHFIDCMSFLTGSKPSRVHAEAIASANRLVKSEDNINVNIRFENGSVGNLVYVGNGDTSVPKEHMEVYAEGRTAILENFQSVTFHSSGKKHVTSFDSSKGHAEEVRHFLSVIEGVEKQSITFDSMYLTTLTTFKIRESLQKGLPVALSD